MIALDIAGHFKERVRSNGFKAQVVAPSRVAALRYAERLKDFGLSAYPIITTVPNDGPEFKAAREFDQEQIESAFVDPEGEPEVVVVVDMLLTGFDAPVEHVSGGVIVYLVGGSIAADGVEAQRFCLLKCQGNMSSR